MKPFLFLFASSADAGFHDWCNRVGIETPAARLRTTTDSVAGRGVFATDDLNHGDVSIKIPEYLALHEYTASLHFPELAKEIQQQKKFFYGRNKWWRALFRKAGTQYNFTSSCDLWQAELTKYSLACIESNSFWKEWIDQWERADPMQVSLLSICSVFKLS